jgi:hypothetical protein
MDWHLATERGDELGVYDEGDYVRVIVNGAIAELTTREAGQLRYALARAKSTAEHNQVRA